MITNKDVLFLHIMQ